jgi:hypothetical protein
MDRIEEFSFANTDFTNLTDVLDDMFHFIGRTSKSEFLRFFKQNKTFAHSKAIMVMIVILKLILSFSNS